MSSLPKVPEGLSRAAASAAYAPLASTPTLQELVCSVTVTGSTAISGTDSQPLFCAPFACKITSLSLFSKTGVAASDTNYWTVALRKKSAGALIGTVAQKTTQVTGGQAVTANADWNFDTVTFDVSNQVLAKGDAIDVAFTLTGSSAGITWAYLNATFRYEPV